MHNLEGFGFCSDCFSLKDNLNYVSSAFPGPKPCFNHQLCCHGPDYCAWPTGHILRNPIPGEWEPSAAAAPAAVCTAPAEFQPAAHEGWESCALQTGKKDQHHPSQAQPCCRESLFHFGCPLFCCSVRIPTIMWSVT